MYVRIIRGGLHRVRREKTRLGRLNKVKVN